MPKLVSIDDQRYAALTLQSLCVTIDPLQASTTSLESRESYLTVGMLPYNRNVTLQTFLSSTRDFNRLHSTFARLYNAAASPASRLRSAGSLAINLQTVSFWLQFCVCSLFMFLSWKIMGDYFSAEGYIMLDNENFPLSLLQFCFCNLYFKNLSLFTR